MHIAVTGATGYVATYLINSLVAKGYRVKGLCRNESLLSADLIANDLVEYVSVDYQEKSLVEAISGCDVVVHLAALVHDRALKSTNNFASYHEVNVVNTISLVKACLSVGIKRFVFISTISASVNTRIHAKIAIGKASPSTPGDIYGYTKLVAESFCVSFVLILQWIT